MNKEDKHFIERYEELLNKGYCDCNEMNCIDNNSPRRILNIVKNLQSKIDKAIEYIEIYRSYENIDNKDYLKGKDEIGCLNISQTDSLLDILKEDK